MPHPNSLRHSADLELRSFILGTLATAGTRNQEAT